MQRNRVIVVLAILSNCLAVGTLAHASSAEDEQPQSQFLVFVDPRIPAAELPATPTAEDRGKILDVLRRSSQLCGVSLNDNRGRDPLGDLVKALSDLELRSDPIAALGHIILTEDTLTGIPFGQAISALVRMSPPTDRSAQRIILMIDEMAPVLAERQLGKTGKMKRLRDPRGRPEVERMLEVKVTTEAIRGQIYGIRFAIEYQAVRLNRTELLQMLAEAKAARERPPRP